MWYLPGSVSYFSLSFLHCLNFGAFTVCNYRPCSLIAAGVFREWSVMLSFWPLRQGLEQKRAIVQLMLFYLHCVLCAYGACELLFLSACGLLWLLQCQLNNNAPPADQWEMTLPPVGQTLIYLLQYHPTCSITVILLCLMLALCRTENHSCKWAIFLNLFILGTVSSFKHEFITIDFSYYNMILIRYSFSGVTATQLHLYSTWISFSTADRNPLK